LVNKLYSPYMRAAAVLDLHVKALGIVLRTQPDLGYSNRCTSEA
jgi:hypothetical protein